MDLLNQVSAFYDEVGPGTAQLRLDAVERTAFDLDKDADALARVERDLGGFTFQLGIDGFQAVSSGPAGVSAAFATSRVAGADVTTANPAENVTALIYINGIATDPLRAGEGLLGLQQIARELDPPWTFFGAASKYRLQWVYNPSSGYSQSTLQRCLTAFVLNVFSASIPEVICGSQAIDLVQSGVQVFNTWAQFPLQAQPAALALAGRLQTELLQGRNVIIVAHSQGNLMAQEALNLVTAPRRCVGMISIAAPKSEGWPNDLGSLVGISVKGGLTQDILLHLGLNNFSTLSTDMTEQRDRDVLREPIGIKVASVKWLADLSLHDLIASYFAGNNSRAWIKDQLYVTDRTLREHCVDSDSVAVLRKINNTGWQGNIGSEVEVTLTPYRLVFPQELDGVTKIFNFGTQYTLTGDESEFVTCREFNILSPTMLHFVCSVASADRQANGGRWEGELQFDDILRHVRVTGRRYFGPEGGGALRDEIGGILSRE